MTPTCLFDKPKAPRATLILAHGAGQPMDSPFMAAMASRVSANSTLPIEVVRFNFPYMERAVSESKRRPPDGAKVLEACWRDTIAAMRGRTPYLFIGGKSLGGRYASMVAGQCEVDGVVCLGYPFHPPGKPDRLRTAHLEGIAIPTLIVQGERDPFGNVAEVSEYALSDRITIHWMPDGDHGFKPRKASGATVEDNLDAAADAVATFIAGIVEDSPAGPVPASGATARSL